MANWRSFYQGKTALVTGGSSGIGLSLAELLVSSGANVAILARRADALAAAQNRLEQKRVTPHQHIEPLSVDVSDYSALQTNLHSLFDRLEKIDMLFNSAGVARPGEFLELDNDVFNSMMNINFFGTVHAIKLVLPRMLQAGKGHIINISSVVGYLNIYGYSAYGASKYAVTGLSDALRMELKPRGIQVSLVYPPDTDTPQLAYEKQFKPKPTQALSAGGGLVTPEAVAREILQGVYRKKYVILPGFENKVIYYLVRLLGKGFAYGLMDRIVVDTFKKNSSAEK